MTFPARLHVLVALESPVGLVIRRGPAEHVSTLKWNRTNDSFELGQWLKGRIYERRYNLSPCRRYFLYFARGKDLVRRRRAIALAAESIGAVIVTWTIGSIADVKAALVKTPV